MKIACPDAECSCSDTYTVQMADTGNAAVMSHASSALPARQILTQLAHD